MMTIIALNTVEVADT